MTNRTPADLASLIKSAFPLHPVPTHVVDNQEMHQKAALSSEYGQILSIFLGKSWAEITYQQVWDGYSGGTPGVAFYLLSCEALRYYLPAWMMMCIEDVSPEGSDALDPLLGLLKRGGEWAIGSVEDFDKTFGALTISQKAAVAAFLKYADFAFPSVYPSGFASMAYTSYWHQFDTDKSPLVQDKPSP